MTFVRAVEAASYIDGSVGWCVMIAGCFTTFTGYLPPAGAHEIFGDPTTIAAGSFRPEGTAEEVDGGYRVSGRWPFASGSSHSQWFISGCRVTRNGEPVITPFGAPLFREVVTPREHVEMIDTWDSTGLRGTASHDYAIRDAFVPHERTMWFQDQPTCDRPLFRLPALAMYSTFIAAVPLGIARHAIDEFQALVTAKTDVWSQSALADKAERADDLWARPTRSSRRDARTSSIASPTCGAGSSAGTHQRSRTDESCGSRQPMRRTARSRRSRCSIQLREPARCTRHAHSTGACATPRTAVQHICTQEVELRARRQAAPRPPRAPGRLDDRLPGRRLNLSAARWDTASHAVARARIEPHVAVLAQHLLGHRLARGGHRWLHRPRRRPRSTRPFPPRARMSSRSVSCRERCSASSVSCSPSG